jgi:hypothetical protein
MIQAVGLSPRQRSAVGWWALGLLLALTLVRAATAPRDRWPGLVGDEPTYLMQAESLAWDGDLRFAAEDLHRFRERRGHSPEVILQSGDGGARIVYGKPFLYAAAIAPLVRVMGERGAVLANAIALAAAALLAAHALVRQGNGWGPLWIAVALFASVAFGHVFWIHPDLLLMAASAGGLALAHLLRSPPVEGRGLANGSAAGSRWSPLAWGVAGALLAVPGAWRPPYLLLLVPGAFLAGGGGSVDRDRRAGAAGAATRTVLARERSVADGRPRRLAAFAGGVAIVAAVTLGGQQLASGNWSPYAGERRGFSELEGFPGIDFPADQWSERVESKGNTSWLEEGALESNVSPSLVGWNLAYLVTGRTVGLAPYFLPALAGLLRRRPSGTTRLESLTGLAVPLAFMALRPFNFYGGAGALANRYFLPAFPLFWFGGAGLARCLATALVAAPFLVSLWLAPAAYPMVPAEGYRYVSPAARRLLPIETTQRHVKAPGRADVVHGDLWVRFLDGGTEPSPSGAEALVVHPGRTTEILVGRAAPLDALSIEVLDGAPVTLRVAGPGIAVPAAQPGVTALRIERPTARHPMWWTDDRFWLYRIELAVEAPPEVTTVSVRLRSTLGPR